jgi:imidazoleglycerol phosphate synthase glutamine amidotransferase subunit HisH
MGLVNALREYLRSGRPFFGICLGMQLLFESSEESPGVRGLGIIPGRIVRFRGDSGLKIPQIAWNSCSRVKNSSILDNVGSNDMVRKPNIS